MGESSDENGTPTRSVDGEDTDTNGNTIRGDDKRPQNIEERLHQAEREIEERDREIEEGKKRRAELEEEIERLRRGQESLEQRVRILTNRLRDAAIGPSIKSELVLAFLAGVVGWSPPLWFDIGAVLNRKGRGGDDHGRSASGPGDDVLLDSDERPSS